MDENDDIVGADKASTIVLSAITENSCAHSWSSGADRARSLQSDKTALVAKILSASMM